MSIEQNITLLRKNKRAMVQALRDNGYVNSDGSELRDTMRAADFAKYIRWGSGILDLCVCAVHEGGVVYINVDDWPNVENKESYVIRGIRFRGFGESFLIAPGGDSNKNYQDSIDEAHACKAHTVENSGLDDSTAWTLPTFRQAQIMYRRRKAINEAFNKVYNNPVSYNLPSANLWTLDMSGSDYWYISASSGIYGTISGTTTSGMAYRPVCTLVKSL